MPELVVLLAIVCILVIVEWMREIHTFRVTYYKVQSPKLKHLRKKIVLLSDLHNYTYGNENEKLLKAIRAEKPDLILIAGDMLIGNASLSTEVPRKLIEQLPAICETYYGNGNHEQRMKLYQEEYGSLYDEYKTYLEKKGVHFLENEKLCIKWGEQNVVIYGLEIPAECYKKFQRVRLPEKYLENVLGTINPKDYQILIAHNPMFVPEYLQWGADLIVSGHFHGGVARIPFFRGVITPQGGLFPKYSGELTKEGNQTVVVSKGIGIHTIKVRFLNPAEIVVLQIGDSEE